jgi:hypothetical protein
MRPQARFDVPHGYAGGEAGACPADRARRIALHDYEIRCIAQQRKQRHGYGVDMSVGVLLPRTAKIDPGEFMQSKLSRIQLAVLARENKRRCDAVRQQRTGDGLQLDGFRPGADDQPDIPGTQLSP